MLKQCFLLTLVCLASIAAQSQNTPRIDASAVWQMPPGFVGSAQTACGASSSPGLLDCVVQQMTKAGASPAAVKFTRELFKQDHGEVGFMTSFQAGQPVDTAWITYSWRPNHQYGLLLVNGQPAIVDVEDLKLLDRKSLQQSLQFKNLQNQFPKVEVYAGDRDGQTWPQAQSANGGTQFVLSYPLRNGCPTCAHAGDAIFTWNFSAQGKFLGTSFMGMTPAPLNQ
jgi:hypothetical protein